MKAAFSPVRFAVVALAGTLAWGAPFLAGEAGAVSYGSFDPALIYNSVNNTYLHAYEFADGVDTEYIRVRRHGADGSTLGSVITLKTANVSTNRVNRPAAAFDSQNGRTLVIWDNFASPNYQIRGRLLDGDGATVGSEFAVSASSGSPRNLPGVAFDPVNQRYLAVWQVSTDVYGALLDADGDVIESDFAIATATGTQQGPEVAFDPVNERYLVVWADFRDSNFDIFGQLVDADGNLLESGSLDITMDSDVNFELTNQGGNEFDPRVAFGPVDENFLVIWNDDRDSTSIYAQLVNADGSLQDGNFSVSNDTGDSQHDPSIAYQASREQFVTVFVEDDSGTGDDYLYRQYIDEAGTADGTNSELDVEEDNVLGATAVAANHFCGNVLHASEVSTNPDVINIAASGNCAPDPGLLWPDGEISPTTVQSGKSVTFTVDYWSSSDTPPDTAELLIDLDGDGEFLTAARLGGGAPPPEGGGGNALYTLGWLAAAGLLGLLLLSVARRRARSQPALGMAGGLLLAGLALAIVLTACASSGGGTSKAQEVNSLDEVDSSDQDFTDGKLYEKKLKLTGSARTVQFRLSFSDGANEALGNPAEPHDLVITD